MITDLRLQLPVLPAAFYTALDVAIPTAQAGEKGSPFRRASGGVERGLGKGREPLHFLPSHEREAEELASSTSVPYCPSFGTRAAKLCKTFESCEAELCRQVQEKSCPSVRACVEK